MSTDTGQQFQLNEAGDLITDDGSPGGYCVRGAPVKKGTEPARRRTTDMAGAPQFKVYDDEGQYRAACKHAEDAAALVAIYGDGATIRNGHNKRDIVWTEGAERRSAGDSYNLVADVIFRRTHPLSQTTPRDPSPDALTARHQPFRPTHLAVVAGDVDPVMLIPGDDGRGAAYTRVEWETLATADLELAGGDERCRSWTDQGDPFLGAVFRLGEPLPETFAAATWGNWFPVIGPSSDPRSPLLAAANAGGLCYVADGGDLHLRPEWPKSWIRPNPQARYVVDTEAV